MLMWKAGTSMRNEGYTLVELSVVIAILGLVALLVFPRFSIFLFSGAMEATIQELSMTIESLRSESSMTRLPHRLYFNINEGRYWPAILENTGDFVKISTPFLAEKGLPRGISFKDIVTSRNGKITEGITFMEFLPTGVMDEVTIHLQKEGEEVYSSLVVMPLSGRMRIYDRYVEVIR